MPMDDSKASRNSAYHCFDAMTTAELEGLLRADLDCPGDDALDAETILYILDLLEGRQGDDTRRQETTREKLEEFRALYLPGNDPASLYDWEEDQGEPPAQMPRRRPKLRVFRRLGLVAAVIAVLFATLLAAQATGVDLWGVVARWSDETFHFAYQGDGLSSSWMDGQAELEGLALKEYLPRWIPEGYTIEEVQPYELHGWATVIVVFCGEDLPPFYISVDVFDDLSQMQYMTFEKDDTPVQERKLSNGGTVYFYENCGYKESVYQHENMIHSVSGDLPKDTLMNIYESIP